MRKLLLFCIVIIACSCARKGLPPGGPADVEPPQVISSSPDSGEVEVEGISEICVTFSERMDKRTVRDEVVVRPQVRVKEVRWHKNSFCLVLGDSLDRRLTYSLLVMGRCKDAHGNYMKAPYMATFSASDTLLAGTILGSVEAKGLPAPGIPVWAFDSLSCPEPDFTKDEPLYVSQSGAAGDYRFIGLPSGVYLLFAFKDKNANRAYDEDTDFVSPAATVVHIAPERPEVSGVEIALIDPDAPGNISGVVEHCMPDTVVIAVLATSTEDSLASFYAPMRADSTFTISGLPVGSYSVNCYADLNANRTHDSPEEPGSVDIHVVQVLPEETTKDVRLAITCPQGPLLEDSVEGQEKLQQESGEKQKESEGEKDLEINEGVGETGQQKEN